MYTANKIVKRIIAKISHAWQYISFNNSTHPNRSRTSNFCSKLLSSSLLSSVSAYKVLACAIDFSESPCLSFGVAAIPRAG